MLRWWFPPPFQVAAIQVGWLVPRTGCCSNRSHRCWLPRQTILACLACILCTRISSRQLDSSPVGRRLKRLSHWRPISSSSWRCIRLHWLATSSDIRRMGAGWGIQHLPGTSSFGSWQGCTLEQMLRVVVEQLRQWQLQRGLSGYTQFSFVFINYLRIRSGEFITLPKVNYSSLVGFFSFLNFYRSFLDSKAIGNLFELFSHFLLPWCEIIQSVIFDLQ